MKAIVRIIAVLIALVVWQSAVSMPLRPDLLERLSKEGRIDEAREALLLQGPDLEARVHMAASGSIHVLVLLVDFDDMPADTILHSKRSYHDLLFRSENKYSLRTFYEWNSYGKLDITGEIYGWFRADKPLSYYANERRGMGHYPKNTQKLIEDAVDLADSVVDFSLFDNDGPDGIPNSSDDDGQVDFLCVVHGGQGYEWTMNPDHIHSHVATIRAKPVDGVAVKTYATEPEDGKIGTFAHELGHLLGLPDLYDVTLNTYGIGMWSLMSYGSWGGGDGSRPIGMDAWCKMKLGFLDPVVLDGNLKDFKLPCVEDGPHAVKLWSRAEEGPQYFLVENRRAKSWDSFLSWFGEGLLVYHVDERLRDNSSENKHLVSLEQADGEFDLEERRVFGFGSDGGDPYPGTTGNREFSWNTLPSNYSNEGNPTEVSIRNISNPGDTMTFDAEVWSPIVLFESLQIDDRYGDGDGEPDPGEEIAIGLRLRNHGTRCTEVNAHIHTDDPLVYPQDSYAALESLPEMSISDPLQFDLAIDAGVPEPYQVRFRIDVEAVHDHGHYSSSDRFVIAVPLRHLTGWPEVVPDAILAAISIADVDNDGDDEIVVGCSDMKVYVWEVDGSLREGWPAATQGVITSKPAVCDIDVDGKPDIIVSSRDGRVYAFGSDGSYLAGWPQATEGVILSAPLLADIDDDGMVEVICGSTDGKVYGWNEDGSPVPGWPVDVGGFEIWMSAAAADLDGDHVSEIVVGGYGGPLYAIAGDGSALDGWPIPVGRGCGRGAPSIADFDGDGSPDIAVSGLFANSIYLLRSDGTTISGWPRWSFNCSELSAPIPADIDNDGLPEIAVSTSCGTIVVWNVDGSYCEAIDARANSPVYHSEPIFADLDGNGSIEGLVGTTGGGSGEIDAFGGNGRILGFPIPVAGDIWSTPAVADIDNDGYIELVAATTAGEVHVWRFIGAKGKGRVEYPQARGDVWNTGYYGFTPNVNVPLPDLALSATDIFIEPAKPKEGESIRVDVTVTNAGHWIAEGFTVGLYHDSIEDSLLIESVVVDRLLAKRDTTITFSWTVPGGMPSRLVYVDLDAEDEILELSELNNRAARRFYLSVADLWVWIQGVEPFPVVVGDSVTVLAGLKNVGEDIARDFNLSFFDSVIAGDRRFATFEIDSLVPGGAVDIEARYRIDGFGSDYIRILAAADPEDRVLEYHLSNNTSSTNINSGISGNIVATPHVLDVSGLSSSRSYLAFESEECNCVLASGVEEPFDVLFSSPGRDVDLSRNTMVFSSGGDIVAYDLSDSVFFVVSTDPSNEVEPALWGDNFVWAANWGGVSRLLLKRSLAAMETIRTVDDGYIVSPDIAPSLVVWEEEREAGSDIFAYDLKRDTLMAICEDNDDQVNPKVWGRIVVWEDLSEDGGDIVGFDIDKETRLSIGVGEGLQWNASLYGDLVVWQDSRNGNWDIYGYSLAEEVEFPVSRQVDDQLMPILNDSTVFWIDQRSGEAAVRGLRFGGRRQVADVRRFEALSQDGQITVLVHIRQLDDGITYRFYRYPDERSMPPDRDTHIRREFELNSDSVYVYADTLVAAMRPFFYTLGVIDGYGEETFHGPVGGRAYTQAPKELMLGLPSPNPCRHGLTVSFGLPRTRSLSGDASWPDPDLDMSQVHVGVYSVTGALVRTLQAGRLAPGYYTASWDGRSDSGERVSSGVYFIRAVGGADRTARKVILLR